jgi:hypothetical protein
MHKTDHYVSRWMKPADLSPDGDNFTITDFFTEVVGQKQEGKPIMSFAETEKDFILNKTQWEDAWNLLGDGNDNADSWIGKRIKLHPVQVETRNSGLVDSIQVLPADPVDEPAEVQALSNDDDDEPPF